MPSPFPGMDPFLESPEIWPDLHHGLISGTQAALNLSLRPSYIARVELRIYVADDDDSSMQHRVPDVHLKATSNRGKKPRRSRNGTSAVLEEPLTIALAAEEESREARVEIRHVKSNSLVTVIEILSPSNKIRGSRGRASFLGKREEILAGQVHWVEIDLLRGGIPSVTRTPLVSSDYRILISRGTDHLHADYWPFSVRQPLPPVPVPLRPGDADFILELSKLFREAYERGAYDASIDYHKEPDPPLSKQDVKWADQLLRRKGLRKA